MRIHLIRFRQRGKTTWTIKTIELPLNASDSYVREEVRYMLECWYQRQNLQVEFELFAPVLNTTLCINT